MRRCCWGRIDNCFDMRGILKIFIFAIALLLPCIVVGQEVETQSHVQVQEYRVFESFIHGEPKLDSVPNRLNDGTCNILVLGVMKFDSLVRVFPNGEKLFSICMEMGIAKKIIANINNEQKWNYNLFNPNCYFFYTCRPSYVWFDILPYLPEKYFNLTIQTYPNRFIPEKIDIYDIGDIEFVNNIQIQKLKYRTYLCLLMKLTYFNQVRSKSSLPPPKPTYLFPDSEFLEGLYIKVLIPLVDED